MSYLPRIDFGGMDFFELPRPLKSWSEEPTWSEDVVKIPKGPTVTLDREMTGWDISITGEIIGAGATWNDRLAEIETRRDTMVTALQGNVSGVDKWLFDLYYFNDKFFQKCRVRSLRFSRIVGNEIPVMPYSLKIRAVTQVIQGGGPGTVATNFTNRLWKFEGATAVSTASNEIPLKNHTGRALTVKGFSLDGVSMAGTAQSTWRIADFPVGGAGVSAVLARSAAQRSGDISPSIAWPAGAMVYVACTESGGHEDAFGSVIAEG